MRWDSHCGRSRAKRRGLVVVGGGGWGKERGEVENGGEGTSQRGLGRNSFDDVVGEEGVQ